MQTTTYELALNEFRDASAAVRLAFGQVCDARELQIIADSQHKTASLGHAKAMSRLELAEAALMRAREAPSVVAIPPPAPTATPERVTQADIDTLSAPIPNGVDDQPLHIG